MLFKTIEEIREYLSVNITADFKQIKPYLKQAEEKYIKPILGKNLLEEMTDFYNIGEMPEEYAELLSYIQMPLVNFAYFLSISNLNLQITSAGFVVSQTNTNTPASKFRTDDLKKDLETAAFSGIEILLKYLEENVINFPLWLESNAYTKYYEFFISNAADFHQEVNINNSRRKFLEMRQTIKNVEKLQIEPVISKEYADSIKEEIKNNSLSDINNEILILLKSAEANLVAAKCIDVKFENTGQMYLSKIKILLDKNPDNYPLYVASDIYDIDKISNEYYENEEESGFFNMGGPV